MELEPIWSPSPQRVKKATLTRYARWLEARLGREFNDYEELWSWSVEDLDGFWASIWEFFDVEASQPYEEVLADREMPGARWFPGATLNWAEHVLRTGADSEVAIVHASEQYPEPRDITWADLREMTARIASGLRRIGVGPGDPVVAYLPNIPEAVAALLACASVGAIWSSCSPDFGAPGAAARFAQLQPKVLLTVDGYRYGGRAFDRLPAVAALREALPSLEHVVLLPYLDPDAAIDDGTPWADLVADREALRFEPLAFDHPLWVLYTSGTTGLPKGIVHGHGGILLEQLKHNHLHLDAQPGDRVFWFTTTGWMMWNLLVGCLLTGASIVLFDGNPGYPNLGVLWELAARTRMTHFGTSATFISSCMKAGIEPATGTGLDALRVLGSTGSPLSPDGFRWVYEKVGSDISLTSISGGSDLCTAFLCGNPWLPVYAGEIQCRGLGARVESWDESGHPRIGQVGELVLTEPMPSMPLNLWGDDGGERYRDSYFNLYPGTWRHGDWVEITPRGTAIIYGRSDSTINRGGVRMGTAEIYPAVLSLDTVEDALVVDVSKPGEESWMPLFVVLAPGSELNDELTRQIAGRIREACSPRHVPDAVFAVPAIPRTITGKALEVPVKRLLMGRPAAEVASRGSLANPEALDWFAKFADSRHPAPK